MQNTEGLLCMYEKRTLWGSGSEQPDQVNGIAKYGQGFAYLCNCPSIQWELFEIILQIMAEICPCAKIKNIFLNTFAA